MAYIVAKLSGEKKRGGFLSIDGGAEIELFDGTVIKVEEGSHHLSFSSQASVVKAGKDLLGVLSDGALNNIAESKDYDMTVHFNSNTVMLIDIVSDSLGRILGAPDCQMTDADDEKFKEIEALYQESLNIHTDDSCSEEEEASHTFNKLMLISLLTFFTIIVPLICGFIGWIKQIKFLKQYGYKPKHSGLQGFVSILCAIGGFVLISQIL